VISTDGLERGDPIIVEQIVFFHHNGLRFSSFLSGMCENKINQSRSLGNDLCNRS
jgi:hypothetical protein